MDVDMNLRLDLKAKRTGPGGPAGTKLDQQLFDSIESALGRANYQLDAEGIPFKLTITKKEVVSR